MGKTIMTPEQYTANFREVFTYEVDNEPRIPASQKSLIIDDVCGFVANDCREPSLQNGEVIATDKLGDSTGLYLSLDENIRNMQLDESLKKMVKGIAHASDQVVRHSMDKFLKQRANEASKG